MFENMLPEDIRKDLRKQQIDSLRKSIDYILEEIEQYKGKQFAKVHGTHRDNTLHTSIRHPIHAVLEQSTDPQRLYKGLFETSKANKATHTQQRLTNSLQQ